MTSTLEKPSVTYETKGERLSHILDMIGFKQGHGRITELHNHLLNKRLESLSELKYMTVKSWFGDSCPPMKKIKQIINALDEDYAFNKGINLDQVMGWWKVGGYYPFSEVSDVKPADNESGLVNTIKKVDSIFVGQVHLLIYQTASELNINLITEIKRNTLEHIFDKVVTYCQENKLEIDSPQLKDTIVNILRLAKDNLLD